MSTRVTGSPARATRSVLASFVGHTVVGVLARTASAQPTYREGQADGHDQQQKPGSEHDLVPPILWTDSGFHPGHYRHVQTMTLLSLDPETTALPSREYAAV